MSAPACPVCGDPAAFPHDHRPDQSGLDDGPLMRAPRKRPVAKSPSEMERIRKQGWETRRQRYGTRGHDGSYAR